MDETTDDKPKTDTGLKVWKDGSETTVAPTFSRFPMVNWMEWEQDCKQNYGDTRWLKAWMDHQASVKDVKYSVLLELYQKQQDRITELEIKMDQMILEPKKENKPQKVRTLGKQEED